MLCERSRKYHPPLRKFKRDNTGTRKCECPFKIRGYMMACKKWKFSVICGLHNHDLCAKLQGHSSVCRLNPEEKTCISDMSLNLFQPKNILATLKWKEFDNVSNIRQVYNIWYCNNKTIRGDRSEMQQVLKLLGDNKYVSWYRTCDDECGKENNFRWALELCRSLLKEQVEMPKAIVTDHDIALMNALAKVKVKVVCAWTDNVRHLGNTTTNRVESAHASMKNWLVNSKGDLCRDWDSVNLMIENQHNEIQTTFGRSITVLEHRFKDNILYSQLIGNVSRVRLNYIFEEAKRGEVIGSDSAKCGCTISKIFGLPCACDIAKKIKLGEAIRMDEVIPHWKRLSFDDDGCIEGRKLNISITS
ncbi:uncharacterized protein LOC131596844 [Vicia villosa]|uniref:uncharacterized protein LOC131596844 n=1 Tax=Vicia villosa TaxID=3911 RepID=UPI00273B7ED0|nr:uncharacterized protein LOC131596844 [Vicia villosa]